MKHLLLTSTAVLAVFAATPAMASPPHLMCTGELFNTADTDTGPVLVPANDLGTTCEVDITAASTAPLTTLTYSSNNSVYDEAECTALAVQVCQQPAWK